MRLRVAAGLAITAIACSRHAPPPPPAEPAGLEVLARGLYPRAPLQFAIAKGTTTALRIDIASQVAAGEIADRSPVLHVAVDLAVDDVLPDGRMHLVSTIRSLTTDGDDPTAAHANEIGAQLAGLAITATLSPNGAMADVHATDRPLPDDVKAQLAQILSRFEHLAPLLPSAPVGIGAIWRSTRPIAEDSPLALQVVTTVALTGRDGARSRYAIYSELSGSDQTAVVDGMPVEVRAISGTASGTETVDLGRYLVEGTHAAELHMDMTTGSDRTPMMQRQQIRVGGDAPN